MAGVVYARALASLRKGFEIQRLHSSSAERSPLLRYFDSDFLHQGMGLEFRVRSKLRGAKVCHMVAICLDSFVQHALLTRTDSTSQVALYI